jgi:hypothetical protein
MNNQTAQKDNEIIGERYLGVFLFVMVVTAIAIELVKA